MVRDATSIKKRFVKYLLFFTISSLTYLQNLENPLLIPATRANLFKPFSL